jgi:hypothetical protein
MKEAICHQAIANPAFNLSTCVEVSASGERNETLGERPQLFGLGFGGENPVVLEQGRCQVHQRRAPVFRSPAQLTAANAMAH